MNKKSRRKALKAMAVVAPAVWVKPIVDSVAIPAHAFTTGTIECANVEGAEVFDWYDFNGRNYLPCFSQEYMDSECLNATDSNSGSRIIVYLPGGDANDANQLCNSLGAGNAIDIVGDDPDFWFCDNCGDPD